MVTAPSSTTDAWNELVKKTRRSTFGLDSEVIVKNGQFVVRTSGSSKGCLPLVAAMFVLCLLVPAVFFVDPRWPITIFMALPSTLFAVICFGFMLWFLLRTSSMSWESGGNVLSIRTGFLGFRKTFEFDRDALTVYLTFGAETKLRSLKDMVILSLRMIGQDDSEVRLAGAYQRDHLLALFDHLAAYLSGGVDQTGVRVTLPDGKSLAISKAPLGHGIHVPSGSKTAAVTNPSKNVWLVRAPFSSLIGLFLLIGFGATFAIVGGFMTLSVTWFGIVFVLGGLVFVAIVCLATGASALQRVLIDGRRKTIRMTGPTGRLRKVPFKNVAAVQLCSKFHKQNDGDPDFTTYEVNLVLHEPPGERVPILYSEAEPESRDYAGQFGEILDRPLLDHVTSFE